MKEPGSAVALFFVDYVVYQTIVLAAFVGILSNELERVFELGVFGVDAFIRVYSRVESLHLVGVDLEMKSYL